jgi:hypothetical protein
MTRKKRMSEEQEFEIMKLVLDKFLWLGFAVMAFGVYKMIAETINEGIYYVIAGIAVLVIFLVIIVKEYEVIKK